MLSHFLETWSSLYSNHSALRTAIEFIHIGGLMVGGGCAVTADVATIAAARGAAPRSSELSLGKRTHRLVVVGLAALFASGVLLLAADVETYWYSRIFWVKMALIAVLLVNGALLVAGERRLKRGDVREWTRLYYTATASLVLWFLTTLAGAALPNIG